MTKRILFSYSKMSSHALREPTIRLDLENQVAQVNFVNSPVFVLVSCLSSLTMNEINDIRYNFNKALSDKISGEYLLSM